MSSKPSTRLYVLLARKAPIGVVFRRGPSKQVMLLSWNTETHEIRKGQWFKGRIYERRCDLSPSGEKLVYLAAKNRPPIYAWTAVSRPPFLTALALWPNAGACGGGGLFQNERTLALDHFMGASQLAEGFRLPKAIATAALKGLRSQGDDAIWGRRLLRDGWVLKQAPAGWVDEPGSKIWHEYSEPGVWTKAKGLWSVEMRLLGVKETDGSWYVTEHRILDSAGDVALNLGRSDWADWSRSDEVLFAKQGRLCRIAVGDALSEPIEVADLRELRFEEVATPPEARVWSGRAPRGEPLG